MLETWPAVILTPLLVKAAAISKGVAFVILAVLGIVMALYLILVSL